jgi:hypothetical protein
MHGLSLARPVTRETALGGKGRMSGSPSVDPARVGRLAKGQRSGRTGGSVRQSQVPPSGR